MMALSERQSLFKVWLKEQLLSQTKVIAFGELESKAHGTAGYLFPYLTSGEVDEVVAELSHEHTVTLNLGAAVVDNATFERWIEQRKADTKTPRWDAYRQLLICRDWKVRVIETLGDLTDEVVELLGDPKKQGRWLRRGLLMGEVQSGKTATYLGVLNKALDYGYGLVIVIGGHTKELRRQTQQRVDTDLIGFESEYLGDNIAGGKAPRVGIGKINHELRANVLTTVLEDFSKKSKQAGVTWITNGLPTVFVIKKNAKLIDNVRLYIQAQAPDGGLNIPTIVIDDESDWGTPNTGSETDPTRVNKEIRKLLDVSTRSSYLGITATPFANIFIDDEASWVHEEGDGDNKTRRDLSDLFPRDYIRVMSSPTNYLGIGHYFPDPEVETHRAVRIEVDDCLTIIPIKHKKELPVPQLPETMKVAIIEFLLGTAVRRLRNGKSEPASMLINVSRFNEVQRQVFEVVDELVQRTANVILAEFARPTAARSQSAEAIRKVWSESFHMVTDVSWAEVAGALVDIADSFRVELVNSQTAKDRTKRRKNLTADQRKSEDLRPTVYVGGDVLARGLTLNGLQVSYFVREPRTMDTLMQTGRWFGYREGFDDLVRIWMPETTRDDFAYSAEVTGELRDLLFEMRARELTPRDFGLRVRANPESVAIVAANKAQTAEKVEVGPVVFEDRLLENFRMSSDPKTQQANREAVSDLILASSNSRFEASHRRYPAWRGVPQEVIVDFFKRYRGHPKDEFWGSGIRGVIPLAEDFDNVKGADLWDVVLVRSGDGAEVNLGHGHWVPQSIRNKLSLADGDVVLASSRKIASADDAFNCLTENDCRAVSEASLVVSETGQKLPLLKLTTRKIEHPMLMIYALTADHPSGKPPVPIEPDKPLISVCIAYPKMDDREFDRARKKAKTYLVNTVWIRNYNGYVDDGDDYEDGRE
jgi:hypothetical protein